MQVQLLCPDSMPTCIRSAMNSACSIYDFPKVSSHLCATWARMLTFWNPQGNDLRLSLASGQMAMILDLKSYSATSPTAHFTSPCTRCPPTCINPHEWHATTSQTTIIEQGIKRKPKTKDHLRVNTYKTAVFGRWLWDSVLSSKMDLTLWVVDTYRR